MSEKLCTLRTQGGGGGAKYTETVLWTNPSPTSDFATQDVTLSDSIDNYKYIKIVWKAYKSATTTSSVIVLVNDFKSFKYVANYTVGSLASNNSSNQPYARRYVYVSDTVIGFHDALRIYAAATSNDMAIPLEILGLNELAHGTVQTATGTCERGASPITVNLGFRPSFVSLYKTNASSSGTSAGDSLFVADTGFSTSYVLSAYKESSGSTFTKIPMGNYITITDTGFIFTSSSTATFRGTYRYVAIGSTTE